MDTTQITETERDALVHKIENPDDDVRCPRCGKWLLATFVGSSLRVDCETEGCLHTALRGI